MSDTASTLATLRRLADEATPGPWATTGTKQCGAMSRVWPRYPSPDCICTMQVSNCSNWMRDRDYIAALHPGTVRKLLDVAEAAAALAARVRTVVKHANQGQTVEVWEIEDEDMDALLDGAKGTDAILARLKELSTGTEEAGDGEEA